MTRGKSLASFESKISLVRANDHDVALLSQSPLPRTPKAIRGPGANAFAPARWPVMRPTNLVTIVLALAFVALVVFMPATAPLFHWMFPDNPRPVFLRASFLELTLAHAQLVALSAGAATAFAISI